MARNAINSPMPACFGREIKDVLLVSENEKKNTHTEMN